MAGERAIEGEEELAAFDRDNPPNTLHEYWWHLPCSLVDRTGLPQLTSIRMFFSQRQWAAHPVQRDHRTAVDEILLAYPLGGGRSLRVLAVRGSGCAFGLRELTLTELLLPHLRPLLQATLGEHVQAAPADGALHPGLTGRQREILHLVALGMSNRQVGRQLGISENTVRKHLENTYERLGVQSRTEAILCLGAAEVSAG